MKVKQSAAQHVSESIFPAGKNRRFRWCISAKSSHFLYVFVSEVNCSLLRSSGSRFHSSVFIPSHRYAAEYGVVEEVEGSRQSEYFRCARLHLLPVAVNRHPCSNPGGCDANSFLIIRPAVDDLSGGDYPVLFILNGTIRPEGKWDMLRKRAKGIFAQVKTLSSTIVR